MLESRFDHKELEKEIYKRWEASGFFNPDICVEKGVTSKSAEVFSVVLPPPNVTGTLHIGHAFEDTIQDIAVRFARMRGKRTLWIPGTDHAAIATQAKIEKMLQKEGKTKHDLGREAFLETVNKFAQESHDTIVLQIKRIGASLDWSREAYTLDEKRNVAVRTAFKKMHDLGLVYRGYRVVNWDPKGQTVISDDEIIHEERPAKLYTFRYSKDFPLAISTTRPETKVGDTAVAVHPEDPRYKKYIGKEYTIDFCGIPLFIKVIADPAVEKDFGTGALGVTPAHSMIDWEMAQKHKLPLIPVIDEHARMRVEGPLQGMKTTQAREWIVQQLREQGLLEKEEDTTQNLSLSERTGATIEPLPKLQWFVAVDKKFTVEHSQIQGIQDGQQKTLKELMLYVVESGQITILPERFQKTYFQWIENLRDWCVSRQLWFGHRIPVWYCGDPGTKRMGFAADVINQVFDGKISTWRPRDHDFKVGDVIAFENSSTKKVFGYGILTKVEKTTVGEIDLQDKKHHTTYSSRDELIAAFKLRNPGNDIQPDTPVWLYEYTFDPNIKKGICGTTVVTSESPATCPTCGAASLEQDPDTFDTWFSSGMWTFSTLGWPEDTSDLKTFHPTTFMAPGYEILFLWVARMILMSGCLLGQIPFRTVYLHGIVRDSKGRKFSKSLGNGIDPLELADTYGADALRMGLVIGASAGNDVTFSEDKVRGYRNFSTKIWNAARFVLMNQPENWQESFGGTSLDQARDKQDRPESIKLSDIRVQHLKDMADTKKEVTAHLENNEFHLAGEKLYHYFWHTFADKIIEEQKAALRGEDSQEKIQAYYTLRMILVNCLKMLHPFMPFVTEAIYQHMESEKFLIVEKW